ncbi:hypothetical protein B0H14DRAFT_2926499 [Mycena olivaceomarginata]|nr:hypothetical protein B0H14DRAFT_2926499 [Mycena olivaceomarginata]
MPGLGEATAAELFEILKFLLSGTAVRLYLHSRSTPLTCVCAVSSNFPRSVRRICLLFFAYAVYFLRKTKTRASHLFLALSVIVVLFALTQAILDVVNAVILMRVSELLLEGGSLPEALSLYDTYVRIFTARQALLAINKQLYRCAVIWGSSPYARVAITIPALLIISTLAVGLWGTFELESDTAAPFALALITNFILLGLTAGRIYRKGRQATVVLGAEAGARYNRTLEIIPVYSTSSFLLVYIISSVVSPLSVLTALAWGAMAQVVNIVPLMIMVRVGIARSKDDPTADSRRVFYGGNAGRYGMTAVSDDSTPLKSGQYSEL